MHKKAAATLSLTVITSLLYLIRVLDALPSLQLSQQSLAVSALQRVCSPTGIALMSDEWMWIDHCDRTACMSRVLH